MVQDHLISDGLTNIVWSWSPNYGYQDDVFDTYPGDDRVDIICHHYPLTTHRVEEINTQLHRRRTAQPTPQQP